MRPLASAVLLALLALVLTPVSAQAAASTTYFVNCAAPHQGDGTASHPWKTLAAVNRHGAFLPGERVLLKRGTTCRGRLHPTGSGSPGRPIVMGAWGASGARPTVNGGGTPTRTGTIQLFNQQYWTIQDLHVTNTAGHVSTQVYRAGVSIRNQEGGALRGLIVQRLRVDHVASAPNEKLGSSREWGGITAAAGGYSGDSFPGMIIRDNVVDHVGRSGIMVANWEYPSTFNVGLRITGNTVSWARGDGIVIFGAEKSRIDHNVVAHAHDEWPCPLCGPITPLTANAGIWPARSSDIRIDHNEVYGMFEHGGDGEAFDADQQTDRIVFEYNYAHDNMGGGIFFCGSKNVTVRFNIFQNNRRSAFNFIGNVPAQNTRIYNNTVYAKRIDHTRAVRTFNGFNTSDVVFDNNIVENHSSGLWQWPSTVISTSANTLIGSHGTGRPKDSRTSRKDPGLRAAGSGRTGFRTLDGYKPRNHRAAQRGVAIPLTVERDFFGRKIDPRHPPRGAAG